MASIGTQNISFSGLKAAYVAGGGSTANNNLKDGETDTEVKLSYFYSSEFTDDSNIGAQGIISVSDFKNKTFGSSGSEEDTGYSTSDFNFELTFSGEQDRLYPVSSSTSTTSTSSSKYARLFHSNVHYSYPSILLCPQSGDPTIETDESALVWIKFELTSSNRHFQVGIIHKQGESSWSDLASDANILRYRHTTYNDRIALHTYGYITHRGPHVELSTDKDELLCSELGSTYRTTTSNYHNRYGITSGSGSGFGVTSSYYYYRTSNYTYYQSKTSISSAYYIGLKLNYYEITLTGTTNYNSKLITNVKLNNSNLTEDDTVYSGMYLESTDTYFPSGAMIQTIEYNTSNNTEINMGDETNGPVDKTYGYYGSTITFKAFGQRFEILYTDDTYNGAKNIGPKHIILPRQYRTSSSGSNIDIDSWAFFVGDSTSGVNTATWSIQSTEPTNYYSDTFDVSGQSQQSSSSGNWSPVACMSEWVNGSSVVDGTYWTGSKTVKGWNSSTSTSSNSTGSGSTGPGGGGYGGSKGFLYTEVSGAHTKLFICRTPGINFSTKMIDTSNDLKLDFKVHAYGSQMGDLFVHISTDSSTTASASTQLASYTSFSGFTGHSSDWQTKEIDLNSYRTNNTYYIYFASYNATGYKGDLSIDNIRFYESVSGGGGA